MGAEGVTALRVPMRKRYVYRNGKAIEVKPGQLEYRADDTVESFEKRMLATYHQLECMEGSRFNPGMPVNQIKGAWNR